MALSFWTDTPELEDCEKIDVIYLSITWNKKMLPCLHFQGNPQNLIEIE